MLVERLDAPAASVPRKLVIGAQRLWNNVRVPPAGLRDPMIAHQAGLLVDAPLPSLSPTTPWRSTSLGATGPRTLRSSHACGHLLHWALAIDPETRRPLAAVASEVWTRPMTFGGAHFVTHLRRCDVIHLGLRGADLAPWRRRDRDPPRVTS